MTIDIDILKYIDTYVDAMHAPAPGAGRFRYRLVGLYALTLMEREGPIYGYRLSEAIAERTQGAWRPGPGSVYPSLKKLVAAGLASAKFEQRRRTYAITPEGTRVLRTIRDRGERFLHGRWDGTVLWAEILGERDAGEYLLRRLRHVWESLEQMIESLPGSAEESRRLRDRVSAELTQALDHLSHMDIPDRSSRRGKTA
jgi:DNA-binding PadR family transcriptional regulator